VLLVSLLAALNFVKVFFLKMKKRLKNKKRDQNKKGKKNVFLHLWTNPLGQA